MSHPFEDWSAINEGWDTGGAIDMDVATNNLKTVAANFAGPVAMVLVALWALKVAISALTGVLLLGASVAKVEALFTVAQVIGWIGWPVLFVVGLLQWSLFRPMQLQAFEGSNFISGFGEAFRLTREVMVKTLLCAGIWGVSLALGGIVCGIGAIVPLFFFVQAPYLGATTELSPWECMRRSYELSKAYYLPVLGAIAISFVVMAVIQGCGGAIVGGIGGMLREVNVGLGALVANLGADLLGIVGGALILIVTTTAFTTIQSVERGIPFSD